MWQAEERAARLATVKFQGSNFPPEFHRQTPMQGWLLKTRYFAKDTDMLGNRRYPGEAKATYKKKVTVSRDGNELKMEWKQQRFGNTIQNTYKVLHWSDKNRGEVVLDPNPQLVDTGYLDTGSFVNYPRLFGGEVIGCPQKTRYGTCQYTKDTRGFTGLEDEEAFFMLFRIMALASALCDINEKFDDDNLLANELSRDRIKKLDEKNESKYMSQIIQLLHEDKKSIKDALLPVKEFRLIGSVENMDSFLAIVDQKALRNLKHLILLSPLQAEAVKKLADILNTFDELLNNTNLYEEGNSDRRIEFKENPIYSLTTITAYPHTSAEEDLANMLIKSMEKLNKSREFRNFRQKHRWREGQYESEERFGYWNRAAA